MQRILHLIALVNGRRPSSAPYGCLSIIEARYEAVRAEMEAIEKQTRSLKSQLKQLNHRANTVRGKCSALKALLSEIEESSGPGI